VRRQLFMMPFTLCFATLFAIAFFDFSRHADDITPPFSYYFRYFHFRLAVLLLFSHISRR
jgi:hypothetical protein